MEKIKKKAVLNTKIKKFILEFSTDF